MDKPSIVHDRSRTMGISPVIHAFRRSCHVQDVGARLSRP